MQKQPVCSRDVCTEERGHKSVCTKRPWGHPLLPDAIHTSSKDISQRLARLTPEARDADAVNPHRLRDKRFSLMQTWGPVTLPADFENAVTSSLQALSGQTSSWERFCRSFNLPRSYQHLLGHLALSSSSTICKYVIIMVYKEDKI